jgi:uncharacterized protein (DUF488 family)
MTSSTEPSAPTEARYGTIVFTIGHSRHAADHFLALLHAHEIDRLVDVRSQPRSKWAPHFDTEALERLLDARGVDYVYLGRQLGGRPDDRAFYRQDGTVDYARRAAAPDFEAGIRRLVELARDRRTAILCAEEDPSRCHRRLLVAPALMRIGAAVVHVRGDGCLEPECGPVVTSQLDLFCRS